MHFSLFYGAMTRMRIVLQMGEKVDNTGLVTTQGQGPFRRNRCKPCKPRQVQTLLKTNILLVIYLYSDQGTPLWRSGCQTCLGARMSAGGKKKKRKIKKKVFCISNYWATSWLQTSKLLTVTWNRGSKNNFGVSHRLFHQVKYIIIV